MSTASGIPSFCGEGGIWVKFDPEKFATGASPTTRGVWELRAELTRELALDED